MLGCIPHFREPIPTKPDSVQPYIMATNIMLNDKLARNDLALAGKINTTSINDSIWNKMIVKEPWPNGVADTLQTVTVERNLPENIDTWTAIAPNSNSNSCVPVADVVPRGHTTRNYSLEGKAIESDDICVDDTRNAYQVNEQVKAMYQNLRKTISYIWKRRAILGYYDICENKTVCAPGRPTAADHTPNIAATSLLSQQFLNSIYAQLIADSAQQDGGALQMAEGRPQFILITDMESSDAIMGAEGMKENFLWNNARVKELLAPLGVNRAFKGFMHVIETLPRRFTFDGTWHEVAPYETVDATVGSKSKLRTEYLQAPFTESFVFLPTVMSFVVPNAISSVGSGTSFEPQNYIGELKWHNEYDRQDNPDRTIGHYRAVMKAGNKANMPQFGYAIRHLRCPEDLGLVGCTSGDAGASSALGSGDYFAV